MSLSPKRRVDRSGLVIALALLALAGVLLVDLSGLDISPVYGVGPKAMPYVVAAGLAILSIANGVMAWRGGLPERPSVDHMAVLSILAGLAGLMAVIALGGGFILGTAFLFAAVSRAFGRKAFLTDFAIGFVLAFLTYLLFAKLLALTLPVGPLERLL